MRWPNKLQLKMEWADAIMTTCMLAAQRAVLPSKCARSHPWSPILVQAQKKKGLAANLPSLVKANRPSSPCIEQ